MGEEFRQASTSSTLPMEVSRNSLLEAKKLLIKWRSCCRSCKLDTYPRGHCWVAHLLQTTTEHGRKPSHSYHEKDCSFGNSPCPILIPRPLQIFLQSPHLLQGLANKAQQARKMQWRLLLLLGSRGLQREAGAARSCAIPALFWETTVGADTASFRADETFFRSQPPESAFVSKKHSRGSL